MDKENVMYKMEYYLVIENNENMKFLSKQKELEIIIFNEVIQVQKDKLYILFYMWILDLNFLFCMYNMEYVRNLGNQKLV